MTSHQFDASHARLREMLKRRWYLYCRRFSLAPDTLPRRAVIMALLGCVLALGLPTHALAFESDDSKAEPGFDTRVGSEAWSGDESGAQISASLLNEYSEPATLQKAETNYRSRRLDAAMEQFGMLAAMDNHPFAWLRIGNICHRRGDVSGAFDAYRRARQAASGAERYAQLRARAVMNLALLGLDQAQLALEDLGLPDQRQASGRWLEEVRLRLGELNGALIDPRDDPRQAEAPLVAIGATAGASSERFSRSSGR